MMNFWSQVQVQLPPVASSRRLLEIQAGRINQPIRFQDIWKNSSVAIM